MTTILEPGAPGQVIVQGLGGPQGPPGPAGINWRIPNTIQPNTTYNLNDGLTDAGGTYVCILTYTTGSSPTVPHSDTTHWQVVSQPGTGINWRTPPTIQPTTAYVINDGLEDAGGSWRCILGYTTGASPTVPSADPTHWKDVALQGPQGIQGVQGVQGVQGNPGAIGPAVLTWHNGTIQPSTTYATGPPADALAGSDGGSYRCILGYTTPASAVIDPSADATHWYPIARPGSVWNPQTIDVKLTTKFTATAAIEQVIGTPGNYLQTSIVAQTDRAEVHVDLSGLLRGNAAFAAIGLLWADNATAPFPLWQGPGSSGSTVLKTGVTRERLGVVPIDQQGGVSKRIVLTGLVPGHTYNICVTAVIVSDSMYIPLAGLGGASNGALTDVIGIDVETASPYVRDRHKVYLAGSNQSIVVLNTPSHIGQNFVLDRPYHHQTGAVIRPIGGGFPNGPFQLGITPDGTRLLAACLNGALHEINTSTDLSISARTPSGTGPSLYGVVAISNSSAYVTDHTNNVVWQYTIGTGFTGTSIGVGTAPGKLRATKDGSLVFVPNTGTNTLSIIDTSSNAVTTVTFAAAVRPKDIGVMPGSSKAAGGTIWVVETGNRTAIPVTWGAGLSAVTVGLASTAMPYQPSSIAVDPDGKSAWIGMNGTVTPTTSDFLLHIAQLRTDSDYPGQWFIPDSGVNVFGTAVGQVLGAFIDSYGSMCFADYNNGYFEWHDAQLLIDGSSSGGFVNTFARLAWMDLPHT